MKSRERKYCSVSGEGVEGEDLFPEAIALN